MGEPRIPDHPLVKETIDNCLYEAMDLHGLRDILKKIQSGEIRALAVENGGTLAAFTRDPEFESLRVPG